MDVKTVRDLLVGFYEALPCALRIRPNGAHRYSTTILKKLILEDKEYTLLLTY